MLLTTVTVDLFLEQFYTTNMLSNVSIKRFLESGDIIIDPWHDKMMGAARVLLHLGEKIIIPKPGKTVDIKTRHMPDYKEVAITDEKPFKLAPESFVLSETFEHVGISEKIGMMVDGRSTLARFGLTIHQSATIIDTGQAPKKITLELKNSGPNPILLYPKMKIVRACFFELNPPATTRYDSEGKYLRHTGYKPIMDIEFKER